MIATFKRRRVAWSLAAPAIIVLLIISTAPLIYTAVLSFFQWDLTRANIAPKFLGLGNYIQLLTKDSQFLEATWHTALLMGISVPVQTVIAMGLALLLNQNLFGTRVFTSILLIPMSVSSAIVSFLFGILFNDTLGPINFLFREVGLPGPKWVSDPSLSLFSVGLVDTWQWTPFLVLMFMAALKGLPEEPYEAAKVDGASAWQLFRYLTLPLMKYVIAVGVMLRAMDVFKWFDYCYLLTSGGPGTSSQVLSYYGYKVGTQLFRIGYASAISVLMTLVFVVLAILYYRLIREQL
jgi:multiple sugar transport system permease protein